MSLTDELLKPGDIVVNRLEEVELWNPSPYLILEAENWADHYAHKRYVVLMDPSGKITTDRANMYSKLVLP